VVDLAHQVVGPVCPVVVPVRQVVGLVVQEGPVVQVLGRFVHQEQPVDREVAATVAIRSAAQQGAWGADRCVVQVVALVLVAAASSYSNTACRLDTEVSYQRPGTPVVVVDCHCSVGYPAASWCWAFLIESPAAAFCRTPCHKSNSCMSLTQPSR